MMTSQGSRQTRAIFPRIARVLAAALALAVVVAITGAGPATAAPVAMTGGWVAPCEQTTRGTICDPTSSKIPDTTNTGWSMFMGAYPVTWDTATKKLGFSYWADQPFCDGTTCIPGRNVIYSTTLRVWCDGADPDGAFTQEVTVNVLANDYDAGPLINATLALCTTAPTRFLLTTPGFSPQWRADYDPFVNKPVAGYCQLTPGELVGVARHAGWEGSDLVTAVAIAMARSNRWVNHTRVDTSADFGTGYVGLWENRAVGILGASSAEQMLNPSANAATAFERWEQGVGSDDDGDGNFDDWGDDGGALFSGYLSVALTAVNEQTESLEITSCSQTQHGVRLDPDAAGDDQGEGGYECGGFNPLNYLKCLFIPRQGLGEHVGEHLGGATDRFPISLGVTGGTMWGQFHDAADCVQDGGAPECGVGGTWPAGTIHTPEEVGGDDMNIFTAAASSDLPFKQGTAVYETLKWLIFFGTGMAVWWRVSKSFGSKDVAS